MSWRRGRLAATVAGLAAGLIVGVAGTAGIVQLTKAPASRVVAQIALSPLPAFPPWNGVTGTAVMRVSAGQQVMAVTLHAPSRPGFHEVWLALRPAHRGHHLKRCHKLRHRAGPRPPYLG
jgi:hypothetical protein